MERTVERTSERAHLNNQRAVSTSQCLTCAEPHTHTHSLTETHTHICHVVCDGDGAAERSSLTESCCCGVTCLLPLRRRVWTKCLFWGLARIFWTLKLNGDFKKRIKTTPTPTPRCKLSPVVNCHHHVPQHLPGKLTGMLHVEGCERASKLSQMDTSPTTPWVSLAMFIFYFIIRLFFIIIIN